MPGISRQRLKHMSGFEQLIKYRFRNKELLNIALTHKSYAFEQPSRRIPEWNERLEFFGDSVLGFVVSEYLYKKFKNIQEGELSKFKSHVVCADALARNAARFKVGDFMLLGRGEGSSGCALEAVIGAVYLDKGINAARKFILDVFKLDLLDLGKKDRPIKDYKSALQEYCLKKFEHIPHYELISQEGPEHRKEFVVAVRINGEVLGRGWGLNKKAAEQMAAKEVVEKNLKNKA